MIIIDYSAISISNIAIQKLQPDEDLFRHMVLNSIRMYRKSMAVIMAKLFLLVMPEVIGVKTYIQNISMHVVKVVKIQI